MRCYATYENDIITLTFEGEYHDYEEGAETTDIECTGVKMFDEDVPLECLSERTRAALLAFADDLEFDLVESSDQDDIGD